MADDFNVKDAAGASITIRAKEFASKKLPTNTLGKGSDGTVIDPATEALQTALNALITSLDGKAVAPYAATLTTTITRPADTTAYAVNDTYADSTSAPTAGGFTFTGAGSASGKSGVITALTVINSNDPATPMQGELWIFDSAPTAVNDNAAFALSDADALKLVGVIPFALLTTTGGSGTNSFFHLAGLGLGFTCVGTANLRFLVKLKNAYVPANAETLTFRLNVVGSN